MEIEPGCKSPGQPLTVSDDLRRAPIVSLVRLNTPAARIGSEKDPMLKARSSTLARVKWPEMWPLPIWTISHSAPSTGLRKSSMLSIASE
jgi:hypothetical protein